MRLCIRIIIIILFKLLAALVKTIYYFTEHIDILLTCVPNFSNLKPLKRCFVGNKVRNGVEYQSCSVIKTSVDQFLVVKWFRANKSLLILSPCSLISSHPHQHIFYFCTCDKFRIIQPNSANMNGAFCVCSLCFALWKGRDNWYNLCP